MNMKIIFYILALSIINLYAQQRIVLIEKFSSSTCPPCKTFSENVFSPFLENEDNDDKYTVVNYRMNWPGSGDPYYTDEGGVRKDYYSVSGVPMCFIDAGSASTSNLSSFTSKFNTAFEKSPQAEITSQYELVGSTPSDAEVAVLVTVTPTEDITDAKLHIAVVEEKTTGNVGSNGETEFHYVMMKMVPDASGTSLTLTADTPVTVIEDADLSGTNIEEMDDLHVVVWVQKTGSKEIINSLFSIEGSTGFIDKGMESQKKQISMFHNTVKHTITMTNTEGATIALYNVSGKEIKRFNNSTSTGTIDISQLSHGCYVLKIIRNKVSSSHLFYNIKR